MISATQLKNGKTFEYNGKPYLVKKYEHQKIGRGGASVKLTLLNLDSGSPETTTFNSSVKVEEITTSKRPLQYLYRDDEMAVFMDKKTYEQIEVPVKVIKGAMDYIKEEEVVNVLFWDERALSVEIAPKVTMKVIDTTPGAKGNSATNVFKPATLENKLEVKVPLFIKVGDLIRVDTRSGDYVERA